MPITSRGTSDAWSIQTTSIGFNGEGGFTDPVAVTLIYSPQLGGYEGTIQLRAEREGDKDGRIYSIVCDVQDSSGNWNSASCVVVVPHNRPKK